MADLVHRTAADQLGAADPAAQGDGVTIRLITPGRMFLVSEGRPDLAPNERRGEAPYWLWLALDRALLVGAAAAPEGFASEVTDGLLTFEIAGAGAAAILAMGCTLDAAGDALAPGRVAQTPFAGVKAVLYAQGSRVRFRLHAERSLGAYLLEWFTQAASALR